MANTKSKFANSLRKSISHEKNKVDVSNISENKASGAAETTAIPHTKATATKKPIAAKATTNKKSVSAKNATTKKSVSTKTPTAKKSSATKRHLARSIEKSATKSSKASLPKETQAHTSSKEAADYTHEEFMKKAREYSQSLQNQPFLAWQNELQQSCVQILQTFNNEITTYMNNIASVGNIQDFAQINIAYFERIKNLQENLLKNSSYMSLFKGFSPFQ